MDFKKFKFSSIIFIGILTTEIADGFCPQGFKNDTEFCYIESKNYTTCPYEDNSPYWSYIYRSSIPSNVTLIVPAKWDEGRLFYRSIDKNNYYNELFYSEFHKSLDPEGHCLILNHSTHSSHRIDCLGQKRYCFYENVRTFCENYNVICSAENCACFSKYSKRFFCGQYCSVGVNISKECKVCDRKFEDYGYPKLKLTLEGSDLYLKVTNPLKLKRMYTPSSESPCSVPAVCYAEGNRNLLNLQGHELVDVFFYTLQENNYTTYVYKLSFSNLKALVAGKYWCLGFVYPDLKIVKSNEVFYRDKRYDFMFAVNISYSRYNFQNAEAYIKNFIHEKIHINGYISVIDFYAPYEATIYIVGKYSEEYNNLEEAHRYLKTSLGDTAKGDVLNMEYCLKLGEIINDVQITWARTYIGQTVPSLEMCLNDQKMPVVKKCSGVMGKGAFWEPTRGSCVSKSTTPTTQYLINLLNSNASSQQLIEDLKEAIRRSQSSINPHDVYIISLILEHIASSLGGCDLGAIVEIISNIMDIDLEVLELSQESLNATDKILNALDTALENYAKYSDEEQARIFSKNLDVHIVKIRDASLFGVAFYDKSRIDLLYGKGNLSDLEDDGLKFLAVVPGELLGNILEDESHRNETSLVSAAFKKNSLFNGPEEQIKIAGWIPSLFIAGASSSFLKAPLEIIIKPHRHYRYDSFCTFWRYGQSDLTIGVKGDWVRDHKPQKLEGYYSCHFWHMTHFAVLLDLPSDRTLDLLSMIGSSISLVALLAIYVTAFLSRTWRESDSAKISLNSCATVLLQIITLYFADHVDSYEEESLCLFVGVLLHYSIISQFFWMLVIGILQYRRFVVVFTGTIQHLQLISCFIGWILPIMLVGLTATFYHKGYLEDQYCFLSGSALHWGVFLPVAIVIIINTVIFIRIFMEFGIRKKCATYGNEQKRLCLYVKLCLFLFFVLGLTWAFGLLNGFFKNKALSYIYCLCASLQGLVLFRFHVLLNKDACYSWKKLFRSVSIKSINNTSSPQKSSIKKY